jgi:hypothetical protein
LQLVILGSLPDHSCALINHHPYPRSVLAKHKRKLPPVRLAFRDVDPSAALPGYQSRATTVVGGAACGVR